MEAFAEVKHHLQLLQLTKETDRTFVSRLLTSIVTTAVHLGKAADTLEPLKEAVEIFMQMGDVRLTAEALDWIQKIYTQGKDPNSGLAYFVELLTRAQSEKDRYLEAEITYQMGMLLYEAKKPEEMLRFYERALELCREANNPRLAVHVLGELGGYYNDSEPAKTLAYFEQAIETAGSSEEGLTANELEDLHRAEGAIFVLAGKIYGDQKQYEKAVELYRRAREIFVEAGDRQNSIRALGFLWVAYSHGEQPGNVMLLVQQEQEEQEEQGITEWKIKALINLARLSDALGESEKNGKYILEAVLLSQQIGKPQQEAATFIELGRLFQSTARYEAALTFYHEALDKYREAKDQAGQGEGLRQIGQVYFQIGDNEAATRWYREALAASRAAHNTASEAHTLSQLLLVDANLSDEEALKEHLTQASKTLGEILQWLSVQQQKGAALQNSNVAQTVDYISAQSRLLDYISAEARLMQVLNMIVSFGEGDSLPAAIRGLKDALQMHQELPRTREFLRETVADLYFLGTAYSRLKQYDEALRNLQQAEAIARSFNSPDIIRVLYRIGLIQGEQGRLQDALAFYTQADELVERVSFQQKSEEVKIPLRESAAPFYRRLISLLFKLQAQKPEEHYVERAFLYQEKGKARTLLDLLAEAKVRVHEGINPALLKEEEEIATQISHTQRMFANSDLAKDQKKQPVTSLVEKEQALQALHVKMAAANPKYAELTPPQTADISGVQAILDEKTIFLEYALGEEKSFLWGTTKDSVQVYELPTEEGIDRQIEQYLPTLKTPLLGKDEIGRHVALGKGLYRTLLQPAANQLKGKSTVIIVPDGSLYSLPFEALIMEDGKEYHADSETLHLLPYFIKNYTVTYAPSASVLVALEKDHNTHLAKDSSQSPLLAFGDPDPMPEGFERLPHAAEEVQKIAGIFGALLSSDAVNLREKATKKHLREMDLSHYHMLHFATHAILSDPGKLITQPALVLSLAGAESPYDSFLQMGEIFNLRLNADLVVLSACDTGGGKMYRGEGIVGLTRAFMYAGTPSLVASLWTVSDQSTSPLMEFFYRHLKDGQSKAEALRQAKMELMQTPVWNERLQDNIQLFASPCFWAPFVLIGSGR